MNAAAKKSSSTVLSWTERGLVPDSMIRSGIRQLRRQQFKDIVANDVEAADVRLENFIKSMNASAVALVPENAN